MTQNFCSLFILILSDHCKIPSFLKSLVRVQLISEIVCGFCFGLWGFFLPLESMLVFPLSSQQEKKHQKKVCANLRPSGKTRMLPEWFPTGTVFRCLSCCACRVSWWAVPRWLGNTFLQQWIRLQEAFGTSSEQHLGSWAKSTSSTELRVEQQPWLRTKGLFWWLSVVWSICLQMCHAHIPSCCWDTGNVVASGRLSAAHSLLDSTWQIPSEFSLLVLIS